MMVKMFKGYKYITKNKVFEIFKELEITTTKQYLQLDNDFIEKTLIKLYNRNENISQHQLYFSNFAGFSRFLGKRLSFEINKRPKRPIKLMRKANELKPLNLDSKPLETIKDYEKTFNTVKEMLKEIKNKSEKWFIFFSVKINSGLDYTELCNMKISDLKEYNGYIINNNERNKTKVSGLQILTNKITVMLKEYLRNREIESDYIFLSDNHNVSEIKPMNPNTVNQCLKKLTTNNYNSKVLRSITNEIIKEFGNLNDLEKEIYSKIWLNHSLDINERYTKKLREIPTFFRIFKENYEKLFNSLIP